MVGFLSRETTKMFPFFELVHELNETFYSVRCGNVTQAKCAACPSLHWCWTKLTDNNFQLNIIKVEFYV